MPTDEYYRALRDDMGIRHPRADPHLLDHLNTFEAFLDRSILAGMSFGVEKAKVAVHEGELLGHVVGRKGMRAQPEKTRAIQSFPPLKEKLHVQQFWGCTNFLRYYLPPQYGQCAKVLGEYVKGTKAFPPEGMGAGSSEGDLAVRAIKSMAVHAIEISLLDEAAAIDGSRPLEQIADSSGFAVGGVAVQMKEDLSGFAVLAGHSKGLTPAQQAWAPLSLEGFAQLEVRRAVKGLIGPMKSILWTDHANFTRLQTAEEIQPKHLRWLSELLADGSSIRSLSGRTAQLADGLSRNPEDRDALLSQRTKDLQGLVGQFRGFSLAEFLDDEGAGRPIPWSLLSDAAETAEENRACKAADRESQGTPMAPAETEEGYTPSLADLRILMGRAGVEPTVKVLFVPGYCTAASHMNMTSALSKRLGASFYRQTVRICLQEPPFEDFEGNMAHFERQGKAKLSGRKLANATRVDLLTSVAKLLRDVATHKPDLVIGEGQGGVIVSTLAKPAVVEATLLARVVQREEARGIALGWGAIKLLVAEQPRIGSAKPGAELLLEACPEFTEETPLKDVPLIAAVPAGAVKGDEIREFGSKLAATVVRGLGEITWSSWMELVRCGTTLVHLREADDALRQCMKCLREEASEDRAEAAGEEAAASAGGEEGLPAAPGKEETEDAVLVGETSTKVSCTRGGFEELLASPEPPKNRALCVVKVHWTPGHNLVLQKPTGWAASRFVTVLCHRHGRSSCTPESGEGRLAVTFGSEIGAQRHAP